MNFETETETQLKVVETIMDETNQNCPGLEILSLSRLRLFETQKNHGCQDLTSTFGECIIELSENISSEKQA